MPTAEVVSSFSNMPSRSGWSQNAAQEILNRITYKPGFKMWLDVGFQNTLSFHLEFTAPDSDAPNRTTTVRFTRAIDLYYMTEKMFLFFIMDCIREAEHHEFCEWLKLDGNNLTDPHPPRAA